MARNLSQPLVHADGGGITLLTGGNVALAPAAVARLREFLPCGGTGTELLAFARGRDGVVGCTGRVASGPDGLVLGDLEPFGSRGALPGFARDLGVLIARPGRFAELPRVARPDGPGGAILADGLVEAGLEPVGTLRRGR